MKRSEKITALINVALLATAIAVVVHPRSPFRANSAAHQVLGNPHILSDEEWGQLVAVASVAARDRAVVRALVVSDYECPACRYAHSQLLAQLPEEERLAIGYLHYPLPQHGAARAAARAALCAEEQGRFAEVHDYLFQTEEWRSNTQWSVVAELIDMPRPVTFLECMQSDGTEERLRRHREIVRHLNVSATPTWVFRDYSLVGGQALVKLRDRLAEERTVPATYNDDSDDSPLPE